MGEGAAGVQGQQHHVRLPQGLLRPLHADALHLIPGIVQSRRVKEAHVHTAQGDFPGDHVPGGAGHFRDNGPFLPQQSIEQGAFPHVGAAAQGHPQAAFQDAGGALVAGALQLPGHLLQALGKLPGGFFLVHFLGVVQGGLHPGGQGVQPLLGLANKDGRAALQLPHGRSGRLFPGGRNQPHHRLSLRQVNAAVLKGPAGEFPGLRRTRPRPIA